MIYQAMSTRENILAFKKVVGNSWRLKRRYDENKL